MNFKVFYTIKDNDTGIQTELFNKILFCFDAKNKMKILVNDINETKVDNNLEEIKEIICPLYQENTIINIKDYKLGMKCINNVFQKVELYI